MSLIASIRISPIKKSVAQQLASTVTNNSGLMLCPHMIWFHRKCNRFDFPGVHDMLTDAADWNATVWDMDETKLPQLAQAVEAFARMYSKGFTFYIAWIGDKALGKKSVNLAGLKTLITANEIENRIEYLVHM